GWRRRRITVEEFEEWVRITVGPRRGGWDLVAALIAGPWLLLSWAALAYINLLIGRRAPCPRATMPGWRRRRITVEEFEEWVRITVGPRRGGWDLVAALIAGPWLLLSWAALAYAPIDMVRGKMPPLPALLFVAVCWLGSWALSGAFALSLLF